ncbi:hypothetical protein [Burkholderia cepacia]|uniref:hypothetical protein n=2 Tax=Burkholderiaceae TaxID=119060 RepID=UPI0020188575|nr:hypothetical protein [Burkholderia cepacia]UQO36022.1 hypothetical protein L0Z22_25470 [Burkholderia cepacia]UQO50349.1 hypothetical protein L0Z05_31600 [Burkholderia cepacia]UQP04514.1 hypothetical protein L0Z01_08415 [Burkholderia cepacia]
MTVHANEGPSRGATEELLFRLAEVHAASELELVAQAKSQPYVLMKGYPILLGDMLKVLAGDSVLPVPEVGELCRVHSKVLATAGELGIVTLDSATPLLGPFTRLTEIPDCLSKLWRLTKIWYEGKFSQVGAALAAGEIEVARSRVQAAWNAWMALHDAYVTAMAEMLAIARREGVAPVMRLLWKTAELSKPAYDTWSAMSSQELLSVLQKLLHAHGSRFSVRRDAGSIMLDIHSCASGGMLLQKKLITDVPSLGYVDPGDRSKLANRCNHFEYCTHCVMWNEQLPLYWHGRPMFETEPHPDDAARCALRIIGKEMVWIPTRTYKMWPEKDF